MSIRAHISKLRHSNTYTGVAFYLPLFMIVWESGLVLDPVQCQFTTPSVDARTLWWISNASVVSAIIASFVCGLWLNLFSTSVLLVIVNVVAALTTLIFILVPITAETVILSQTVYGIWSGAILVASLAYFARAIAVNTRTTWVLGVYFCVNTFGAGVISALALTDITIQQASWVLFVVCVICSVLFAFFPEQPVSELVEGYRMPHESRFSAFRRSFMHFWSGQSVLAIIATLFMVLSTELGYQVYDTLMINSLKTFTMTRAQTLGFVFGTLGGVCVAIFFVLLALRHFQDRQVLMVFAVVLLLGYCLVMDWGGHNPPAWRYLLGAVLITLSAQVIMGIGNSLLTKITSPAFQGLWMGLVVSLQWFVVLMAGIWIPDPYCTTSLPYEVTLGIIGLSLLLMIPVYRRLLPQLFSPWSGSALPPRLDERSASLQKALPSYNSISSDPIAVRKIIDSNPVGRFQSLD